MIVSTAINVPDSCPSGSRSPMRPFKRVYLAGALTLVSVQLLAPSAQSQNGTKPSPREPIVEDTRAAPYIAGQRPEIAAEAGQLRSVLGIQVRTKTEEAMGRIIDLLADRDGKVVAAVIEFGGFLGIGTRKIAVEWSALRIEADKSPVAILDVTREQLRVGSRIQARPARGGIQGQSAGITHRGSAGAYCQTDVARASAGGPASLNNARLVPRGNRGDCVPRRPPHRCRLAVRL